MLLVDDDPFDAQLVEHQLSGSGMHVAIDRVDDETGFRAMLSGMPDVILANVVLPVFGARQALAILRETQSNIPLIALAAPAREEAATDALRAGAVDYLFKSQLARLPVAVRAAVERPRMLHMIETKRRNLERLSLQLMTAQENERKRLARELHDELGQRLTVLNMLLYRLRPPEPDSVAHAVWTQAEQEVAGLLDQVRGMAVALRPAALEVAGLEAAIEQLLARLAGAASLQCTFEYAGVPARLAAPVEMTVYRLVQESLTNIVRHARAREVIVEVNGGACGAEIEVIVRDDGVGFDTRRLGRRVADLASGLAGMRERVELLGGSFELRSAPGTGTRIAATIPLRAKEADHEHPAS